MPRGDKLSPANRWFVLGVRQQLETQGLTQAKLAEQLGGDPSYVSKVLKMDPAGRPSMRFDYAEKMCEVLGVDLAVVLARGKDLAEAEDLAERRSSDRVFREAQARIAREQTAGVIVEVLPLLDDTELERVSTALRQRRRKRQRRGGSPGGD